MVFDQRHQDPGLQTVSDALVGLLVRYYHNSILWRSPLAGPPSYRFSCDAHTRGLDLAAGMSVPLEKVVLGEPTGALKRKRSRYRPL